MQPTHGAPPHPNTSRLPCPCSPYSMRGKDIMRRHAPAEALQVIELDQLAPGQPEMGLVQDELARITVGWGKGQADGWWGGWVGGRWWECVGLGTDDECRWLPCLHGVV